jgi:hypothetical protein
MWSPDMRERLLTRHFLQRFLENDLVSPDSDRHDVLALVFSVLLASTLFITVALSLKFMFMPLQSPGRTAILAVDDRMFFLTCSMIVMALVAVASWDALSLDPRDSSILGPLPVAHGVIVRAKLRAVALFAAGFALAVTAMPTVLHPPLMVTKLSIGLFAGLLLILIHFVIAVAAGLFGFTAIVAVRETLRACAGRHFARLSGIVQAVLIVALVTAFLLMPAIVFNAARSAATPGSAVTLLPPFWFLGAHETLAGGLVDGLPREELPAAVQRMEQRATADYRAAIPAFRGLAVRASIAFAATMILAVSVYSWNSRRLPFPPVASRADQYAGSGVLARLVASTLARTPASRAGFFFTVHCLIRSAPHRLVMAGCTAVALALAVATFQDAMGDRFDPRAPRMTGFGTQTLVLAILLAGFGHALRLPADIRANRLFHLAWLGQKERYIDGVHRAALLIVVLPALLALFPAHALLFGMPTAAAHMLTGLLFGIVVVEAFAANPRILPFANSYVRAPDLNTKGPVIGIASLFGISIFTSLEHSALGDRQSALIFWLVLTLLFAALRYQRRRRGRGEVVDVPDVYPPEMARLDLTAS